MFRMLAVRRLRPRRPAKHVQTTPFTRYASMSHLSAFASYVAEVPGRHFYVVEVAWLPSVIFVSVAS